MNDYPNLVLAANDFLLIELKQDDDENENIINSIRDYISECKWRIVHSLRLSKTKYLFTCEQHEHENKASLDSIWIKLIKQFSTQAEITRCKSSDIFKRGLFKWDLIPLAHKHFAFDTHPRLIGYLQFDATANSTRLGETSFSKEQVITYNDLDDKVELVLTCVIRKNMSLIAVYAKTREDLSYDEKSSIIYRLCLHRLDFKEVKLSKPVYSYILASKKTGKWIMTLAGKHSWYRHLYTILEVESNHVSDVYARYIGRIKKPADLRIADIEGIKPFICEGSGINYIILNGGKVTIFETFDSKGERYLNFANIPGHNGKVMFEVFLHNVIKPLYSEVMNTLTYHVC